MTENAITLHRETPCARLHCHTKPFEQLYLPVVFDFDVSLISRKKLVQRGLSWSGEDLVQIGSERSRAEPGPEQLQPIQSVSSLDRTHLVWIGSDPDRGTPIQIASRSRPRRAVQTG